MPFILNQKWSFIGLIAKHDVLRQWRIGQGESVEVARNILGPRPLPMLQDWDKLGAREKEAWTADHFAQLWSD